MSAAPEPPAKGSDFTRRYVWPHGKTCAAVFSADVDGESVAMWMNRGKTTLQIGDPEQRRFGPRVGLYRIMDLLDEFKAKGSFYVPGVIAELYPATLPNILARGHEIGFHGYYHERVDLVDEAENARILDKSMDIFRKQTGGVPPGYRSPSWEMTASLIAQLKARGFGYDSSLMSFDQPYSVEGLTEIPVTWHIDDALYFRYTEANRNMFHPANPNHVLDAWIEEFEGIRESGGVFTITVHPWVSGRPQRIRFLRKLFAHIAGCNDVWWATCGEVADWHKNSVNFGAIDIPARPVDTDF